MWGDQCQTCGGHENEIRFVGLCKFCGNKVCNGCRVNHEPPCEIATARKRRGEGPTVRAVPQETPMQHSVGLADGLNFNIPPRAVSAVVTGVVVSGAVSPEPKTEAVPQLQNEAVNVDDVNAALAEAEANEAAVNEALLSVPLVEVVAENPTVAAVVDPAGVLEGLASPLTLGDVIAPGEVVAAAEGALPPVLAGDPEVADPAPTENSEPAPTTENPIQGLSTTEN